MSPADRSPRPPAGRRPSRRPGRRAGRARRATRPATAPRSRAVRRSPAPRLAGLDLLVVEDDRDTRELFRLMLESLGARVRLAEDAGGGLLLLEERRPDLILLDLLLPGMDGLGFAVHVRSDPRWRAVPILAVTALAGLADYIRHGLTGSPAISPSRWTRSSSPARSGSLPADVGSGRRL